MNKIREVKEKCYGSGSGNVGSVRAGQRRLQPADAGCKAANVAMEPFDKNKPANADSLPVPLIVMVKFRGSVADVRAAVEAGAEAAESGLWCGDPICHCQTDSRIQRRCFI